MNDSDILLSIIIRFGLNVGMFSDWYTTHFNHSYTDYLEYDVQFKNGLSNRQLDEFSFKFLVASLIWKGMI